MSERPSSRQWPWDGKGTLSLGLPWLVPEAVDALDALLRPGMRVLEFGAGGSTVYFAERCREVVSYETVVVWMMDVDGELKKRRLTNARLTLLPLAARSRFRRDLNAAVPRGLFDVGVVDCNPRHLDRFEVFDSVVPHIAAGGWIVLDNYALWGGERCDSLVPGWRVLTFDAPPSQAGYQGRGTKLFRRPEGQP